jgi:hypothetical protein
MTHKELSKNYPSIFTAVHYDRKITVELERSDLDLDEVMDVFETLLVGMGFNKDGIKNWILNRADEYRENEPEFDSAGFSYSDNFRSHFVSNAEADEDTFISDAAATMAQDEQRYEDSFTDHLLGADLDSLSVDVEKAERGLITQQLLDYVDVKGAVTYGELHDYYKLITNSNSFSHVLRALQIPYKNRPTQRYLAKEGKPYSDAKYIVKLANPSNWVVVDSGYRTFNEAPYGKH